VPRSWLDRLGSLIADSQPGRASHGCLARCLFVGIGSCQLEVDRADKAVRAVVLEAARENGLEDGAGRLSRPVIKTEAGLWVVIATGVVAAFAATTLGQLWAAED
jgi:hypothetical protein